MLFFTIRKRDAEEFEIDEVKRKFDLQWSSNGPPLRRPFDCMHVLGISKDRSDIDVELCSDAIIARCRYVANRRRLPLYRDAVFDSRYNCVDERTLREAMPELVAYGERMFDRLHRPVSFAVFETCGPPDSLGGGEINWPIALYPDGRRS